MKCFERSNGLETALYKNIPLLFFLHVYRFVKMRMVRWVGHVERAKRTLAKNIL